MIVSDIIKENFYFARLVADLFLYGARFYEKLVGMLMLQLSF